MEKQYLKNDIKFSFLIGDREKFVTTVSQVPMDGLSPNFTYMCKYEVLMN
jgi:hypothetical protein